MITKLELRTDDPASPVNAQAWLRADKITGYIPSAPTGHSVSWGPVSATVHPGSALLATSYNAYYTTNGTTPTKTNGTKLTSVTEGQSVTGLTSDTQHRIVFTAVNANGEGAESTVVSVTPYATPIYETAFDGTAGAAPDSAYFDVSANAGTAQLTGAGAVRIVCSTTAQAAMIARKTALDMGVSHTFLLPVQVAAATYSNIAIVDSAATPVPAAGGGLDYRMVLEIYPTYFTVAYKDPSNVYRWWRTSDSTWVTTDSASTNRAVRTANTVYNIIIETTATHMRMSIYDSAHFNPSSASGKIYQTGWVLLSGIKAITTGRLIVGDPSTNSNTLDMSILNWRES